MAGIEPITKQSRWIGLRYTGTPYVWTDGSPLTYSNFVPGDGYDISSACVAQGASNLRDSENARWVDGQCSNSNYFVCKRCPRPGCREDGHGRRAAADDSAAPQAVMPPAAVPASDTATMLSNGPAVPARRASDTFNVVTGPDGCYEFTYPNVRGVFQLILTYDPGNGQDPVTVKSEIYNPGPDHDISLDQETDHDPVRRQAGRLGRRRVGHRGRRSHGGFTYNVNVFVPMIAFPDEFQIVFNWICNSLDAHRNFDTYFTQDGSNCFASPTTGQCSTSGGDYFSSSNVRSNLNCGGAEVITLYSYDVVSPFGSGPCPCLPFFFNGRPWVSILRDRASIRI